MQFVDNVTPSFEDFNSSRPTGPSAGKQDAWQSWASMYYPNAFQAAVMNYLNEYEKPINQMLRYQEAGLNPYSFQSSQANSGSSGAAPVPFIGNRQLRNQGVSNLLKGVDDIVKIVGSAKEVYDYMTYGQHQQFLRTGLLSSQLQAQNMNNDIISANRDWSNYWNLGLTAEGNDVANSPRARYMELSTQRIGAQIEQLSYMVDYLYPSQVEANKARAALVEYQKEIESGRYDAVLSIDTGNKTADSFLRALCIFFLSATSFSGKF